MSGMGAASLRCRIALRFDGWHGGWRCGLRRAADVSRGTAPAWLFFGFFCEERWI
jgi:hypothetical protein